MVEHRASPVCTKVCCSFLDVQVVRARTYEYVRSSLTWVKFAPCMCSSVARLLGAHGASYVAYRSQSHESRAEICSYPFFLFALLYLIFSL